MFGFFQNPFPNAQGMLVEFMAYPLPIPKLAVPFEFHDTKMRQRASRNQGASEHKGICQVVGGSYL
jgi:hypothetical protein